MVITSLTITKHLQLKNQSQLSFAETGRDRIHPLGRSAIPTRLEKPSISGVKKKPPKPENLVGRLKNLVIFACFGRFCDLQERHNIIIIKTLWRFMVPTER